MMQEKVVVVVVCSGRGGRNGRHSDPIRNRDTVHNITLRNTPHALSAHKSQEQVPAVCTVPEQEV